MWQLCSQEAFVFLPPGHEKGTNIHIAGAIIILVSAVCAT